MALLTTQIITRSAITPTFAAVAASDTFVAQPQTYVHVKNGGGSTDVLAVDVVGGDPPGLSIGSFGTSVPAGAERVFGPFPPDFFADPTTGLCTMTHSFTTSVTVGVFKVSTP